MHAVDAVGTWVIGVGVALMSLAYARALVAIAGAEPATSAYIGILAVSYVLLARAIALPSTPQRTVWIGIGVALPMIAVTEPIIRARPSPVSPPYGVARRGPLDGGRDRDVGRRLTGHLWPARGGRRESQARPVHARREDWRRRHGRGLSRAPRAAAATDRDQAAAARESRRRERSHRFEREVQLTRQSHPSQHRRHLRLRPHARTASSTTRWNTSTASTSRSWSTPTVRSRRRASCASSSRCAARCPKRTASASSIATSSRRNIILCERGGVPDVAKVVDFGLVKRFSTTSPTRRGGDHRQTLIGTPLYMAPEASPEPRHRRPQRSLRAWRGRVPALTGTPVFQAASVVEVLAHHLHTAPEPPIAAPRAAAARRARAGRAAVPRQIARRPAVEREDAARRLAIMKTGDTWTEDDAARWWLRFRRTEKVGGAAGGATAP